MIVFNIIFTLFIPVLMIFSGYMMYKHIPKDINGIFGYRTEMSRKNQDTWNFAHDYCGRLWIKYGVIMTIASAVICAGYFFISDKTATAVMCACEIVQFPILCLTIIPTERALKETFDENGNRKDNS